MGRQNFQKLEKGKKFSSGETEFPQGRGGTYDTFEDTFLNRPVEKGSEKKRREEKRRKEGYLVPRGSLAGRLATAATAEGGQRKQQRRRRWLEGLLRPPY